MRSEIGVHPWAKYVKVLLDGQELKHCRMGDEEMGCAEVYHHEVRADGREIRLDPAIHGTKMVFGKVELVPTADVTRRIFAEPERAQAIWGDYYEANFGAMDRELAASGWPRKPAARPAQHRRYWLSFDEIMSGLFLRGME